MIIKNSIPMIQQIETMVKDVPGWSPIDQLYSLFQLAIHTSHLDGDIIEIGSWCGRSASVLGMALKMIGKGRLICVDLFPEKNDWKENSNGSFSLSVNIDGIWYGGYEDQVVWREPYINAIAPIYEKYNSVLDVFLKTISDNNLNDYVEKFRGTSSLYFSQKRKNQRFRLAFLDGDHSFNRVCEDIENVEMALVSGGWICFDDAFSHYEGVNRAIHEKIINSQKYDFFQQMTRKFFTARKK